MAITFPVLSADQEDAIHDAVLRALLRRDGRAERLPPMTCIVVQSGSGLPGQGFETATAKEFAGALKKVFGKDWLGHGNPQANKFESYI